MSESMSIAMNAQQRADFDEQGYIVLEDFLAQEELERLLTAVDEVAERVRRVEGLGPDEPFAVRNALAHHDAFLDLIDHPRMLPLVVDAIGWNIQIRTTHLDYRPPYPEGLQPGALGVADGADQEVGYRNLGWHPDLASDVLFPGPFTGRPVALYGDQGIYVLSDPERIPERQFVVGTGQSSAFTPRTEAERSPGGPR